MEYKGFVKKVFEKNGRFSLKCGDDQWYGCGYVKPPCNDNDLVKFEFEENGKYKNVVEGTVKRKDNPNPPVEDEYTKKKSYGGGKGGNDKFWADKTKRDIETQKIISFNGAINVATNVITAAIQNDLLKLTGKAGEKYDAFFALVMEEAETVFRVLQRVPENYDSIMGGGNIKLDDVPDDLMPKGDDWDDSASEDDGEW